ncbi:MAG: hypothetical protein VB142_00970 [Burkholderia sp.]
MLRSESIDAVSHEVGVTLAEFEQWRELALVGIEAGLKSRQTDPLKVKPEDAAHRVGELTMEVEILYMARERQERRPLIVWRSSTLSRAISTIGKPFGLQRVCQVLDFPRATIYAERARTLSNVAHSLLQWDARVPQPKMSDHELLEAIRADLARTPFVGEGARKVWARLCASRTTSACPEPVSRR